jgi:hypothetical protein
MSHYSENGDRFRPRQTRPLTIGNRLTMWGTPLELLKGGTTLSVVPPSVNPTVNRA